MPSLSIVIPAYNEEGTIGHMIERCLQVLPQCTDDFDVTVFNDGSTDATRAIVDEWVRKDPAHVRAIHNPSQSGIAAAFASAYAAATKDFAVLLHADGQYPPEGLIACVPLLEQHSIVLLVRKNKFYGPIRAVISASYRWIVFALFGFDLRDSGCAKCIRRSVLTDIPVVSKSMFAEAELLIRAMRRGHKIAFVTVDSKDRTAGVSHGLSKGILWSTIVDMIRFRMRSTRK